MRNHDVSVVFIMFRKGAVRFVSSLHLLETGVFPNTKLGSIARPAPSLMLYDTILDSAKILDSYRIEAVPILDSNESILGIVTRYDVIKYALSTGWLDEFNVKDVMSTNLVTASPLDQTDKVRRLLFDNAARQVLIVEDGKLVGVVGIKDILEKIYSITVSCSTLGEVIGETDRILSHPAKFVMSRPVFTVNVEDRLSKAIEIMMAGEFCAPVLEGGSVVGIITRGDVVKMISALALMKTLPLSFKGLEKIPRHLLDLADIGVSKTLERLARTTDLFEGRIVIKQQNKEGERTLYIFEMSAKVAKDIVTASKKGWEPIQTFINTLNSLRRQSEKVLTKKRKAERKRKLMDNSFL
ncbi:MAG: hypothetical protein DRJ47_06015 [Thermoprotei archaeon]|nr:MAG: hypothetical protein DRJ47_06015 [Thermoprotei archaeon]